MIISFRGVQKLGDIWKEYLTCLIFNMLRKESLSMSNDTIYTKNNGIFQEFLFLLGHLAHSNLMRQIDFLKTENKILRSKLGKRVSVTASEKQQLIKYGLPLNGSIRYFLSIVCYSTFRKWVTNGVVANPKNKTNRGRWKKEN